MVNEEGIEVGEAVVLMEEGETKTTSLIIAYGMNVEHKGCMQLVRKYLSDFEQFGGVTFKMAPLVAGNGKGGKQEICYATLNEQQGTLLMSYMRNSEIARAFKVRLVKGFYDMAKELVSLRRPEPAPIQIAYNKFTEFEGYAKIGTLLQFDLPQSAIMANRAVKRACGVDILAEMGKQYLPASDQFVYMNPSDLAVQIGLKSAHQVNKTLELMGMQISYKDHRDKKHWRPTDKGMQYAYKMDVDKETNSGYKLIAWHWRLEVFTENETPLPQLGFLP